MGSRVWSWARSHLAIVAGAVGVVVVGVVVVVLIAASSKGSPTIAPGTIVGRPLTSGYKVSGKVTAHSATSLTVRISAVDYSSGDARNTVLFPGAIVEFDKPTDGVVAIARNNHAVDTAGALHNGDTVTVVGEFTTVVGPTGGSHPGYAFIGIEASSH
jgi:hypothetical protein